MKLHSHFESTSTEVVFVKQQLLALPVTFVAAMSLMACTEMESTETAESASTTLAAADPAAEAFASDVADAMVDRLVALLFREFEVTTAENAAVGTEAISNVFFDANYTMRLVGDVEPLQATNLPQDRFERDALAAAKQGQNFSRTERVNGTRWVRKSIAVATTFSASCVHCHSNFASLANPWVGALIVRAEVHD
jgi:hypothetical protein